MPQQLRYAQEADFRQERDFSQKISATLEFARMHGRPLGRVLLYLVLPAALLRAIVDVLLQRHLQEVVGATRRAAGGANGLHLLQGFFREGMLLSPTYWTNAVLNTALYSLALLSTYSYVQLLLQRHAPGPEITVGEVWPLVWRRFFGTFFSIWGIYLLTVLGMLLLLVPGLYLAGASGLFFIISQTEGTGFGKTLSRCLHLVEGKWWSTVGLLAVTTLLFYTVVFGLSISEVLLKRIWLSATPYADTPPWLAFGFSAFLSLVEMLLYPLLFLALAFQYFNLVERKEGVGLRLLVNSLGQTPAPAMPHAHYVPDEEGEY